jgi:hypothetical protein
LETLQRLVITRGFSRQEFQGYSSAQFRVLGLVHYSHAATAQLSQNAVMGDGSTDHAGGC